MYEEDDISTNPLSPAPPPHTLETSDPERELALCLFSFYQSTVAQAALANVRRGYAGVAGGLAACDAFRNHINFPVKATEVAFNVSLVETVELGVETKRKGK